MDSLAATAQIMSSGTVQLDDQNPWPGLAAYDEDAKGYFKGRDAEKGELLRLVSHYPHVALFGKSGLGKSSLLQAGLFPLLRQKKIYLPVLMRLNFQADAPLPPMMQALQSLLTALKENACDYPEPDSDETLWHYLHRRDLELWSADNYPLVPVLVFDQFEEIFAPRVASVTAVEAVLVDIGDLVEPTRVPAALTEAAASKVDANRLRLQLQALDLQKRRYRTVIAFREDHLAAFKAWEPRIPSLLQNFLRLAPMRREQAIAAVSEPGAAVVAQGVAAKIVDFVGNLAGDDAAVADGTVEPVLLSLCCTQLNSRRAPNQLIDVKLLQTAGDDILKCFYTDAVSDLPASVPQFIENLLVQGRRYRGSYPVQLAIDEKHISAEDLALLTDKRRLLRVDPQSGVEKVELIHDRLVGVVVEARELRIAELHKAEAAAKAELEKADAAAAAAAAEKAAADARAEEAAQRQRDREAAQSAYEAERQRIANDRLRHSHALLIMVCLFLLIAGSYAYQKRSDADSAAREAAEARAKQKELQAEVSTQLQIEAEEKSNYANQVADKERDLRQKAEEQRVRAETAERRARESRRVAVALRLATEGTATLAGVRTGTERWALLELVSAHRMAPDLPGVNAQLLDAVIKNGRLQRIIETPGYLAAISPDGKLVVSDAGQRSLRITDAATGRPVGPPLKLGGKDSDTVEILSLAWSADGQRIAASVDDSQVFLWDAISRQLVRAIDEPQETVRAIAFSPDGRELATGDDGGKVWWFSAHDGKPRGEVLEAHKDWVQALAYSPDGKLLASAGDDGNIVLVDTGARQPRGAPLTTVGGDAVLALAFSPDSLKLASGGRDKVLRLWNVATRIAMESVSNPHEEAITALAFKPDGNIVASASEDRTVRYWDSNGKLVGEPMRGHKGPVRTLQFFADGERLLTASEDSTAKVWKVSMGAQLGHLLRGTQRRWMLRMGFRDNGRTLEGSYDDGSVVAWNLETGLKTVTPERPISQAPLRSEVSLLTLLRERRQGLPAAYSRNGQRWVERRRDGLLIQRDVATWQQIGHELKGQRAQNVALAYSAEGRFLVELARDNTKAMWLWNTADEDDVPLKRELPAMGRVAVFAPHGPLFAVGLADGRVKLLERTTGLATGELGTVGESAVVTLAYSVDGNRLAVGSEDGGLQLWSVASSTPVRLWRIEGHVGAVTSMVFSPDGQLLATGGGTDSSVRLWDTKNGASIGIPMKGHIGVVSLAFSPDGKRIASGGRDGTVRIWPTFDTWAEIVCSKLGRDLDREEWGEIVATDMEYIKPCPGLPVASTAEAASAAAARQRAIKGR